MLFDRLKRVGGRVALAAAALAFAALAGCASATGSNHDMNGSGDDFGVEDLAVEDALDLRVPFDFTLVDLVPPPDLRVSCNVDAGELDCNNKCVPPGGCCTPADCPQPMNGSALCTNNVCGVSCAANYKACGSKCIPTANCCVDGDCNMPGDPCKLAAGATCGSNGVCNYLPVQCSGIGQFCQGGTCVCPTGQYLCQANQTCIPNGTCCTSNDCSAVAGEVCPKPGQTCTCLAGFKSCVNGGFSQCILATACCSTGDCTVSGQTCSGPGGSCQCPANQKVCGSACIPSANCCVDADCSVNVSGEVCSGGVCQCTPGQRVCNTFKTCINNGTCCIDSDCPLAFEKCSGIGGSCSCPSGTHACAGTMSCIANVNCCTASECPVTNEVCVGGPPGTCQCPGGQKICGSTNTCIPNATCCNAGDCTPLPQHVVTAACSNTGSGGSCSVANGGCQGGWFDINKTYSDGCECPDAPYGKSCGAATALGAVGYGGVNSKSVTSQLPAAGTEEAWFEVQFPDSNTNPPGNYHPHIALTAGGGEYLFDVYSNCSNSLAYGPLGCNTGGDVGTPQRLLSWDDVGGGAFGAPGCGDNSRPCSTCDCTSPYSVVPNIGTGGQVFIRVFRANTLAVSCNPFTLVASD
jgi:hypothetical protein